jgi:hypothetical protein
VKPLALFLLLCAGLSAQDQTGTNGPTSDKHPRYIIDDEIFEKDAGKKVDQLAKEGLLKNYSDLAKTAPKSHPVTPLAPVSTRPLSPTELADVLRHSTVALGLRYQEPHSRKWHFMIGATGFAVAPGIISTSLHVMTIDSGMMREAQAVAITEEGQVYPVTEILAASDRADTALVSAPGLNLPTLPMRGGVLPGEQVWCMSHPDGFAYMFTSGQVARISRDRYDEKHQPALHVEVTAEYCPGSSGGAVTDAAGNVVAQVASINNYDGFPSGNGKAVYGIVSARTCTAAEEMLSLTSAGENEPIPMPSPPQNKKPRAPKPQQGEVPAAPPSSKGGKG